MPKKLGSSVSIPRSTNKFIHWLHDLKKSEFNRFSDADKDKVIRKLLDTQNTGSGSKLEIFWGHFLSIIPTIKPRLRQKPELLTDKNIKSIMYTAQDRDSVTRTCFYVSWDKVWDLIKDRVTEDHINLLFDVPRYALGQEDAGDFYNNLAKISKVIGDKLTDNNVRHLLDAVVEEGTGYFNQALFYENFDKLYNVLGKRMADALTDKQAKKMLVVMGNYGGKTGAEFYKSFDTIYKVLKPKLKKNPELLEDKHVTAILNTLKRTTREEHNPLRYILGKLDKVYDLIKPRLDKKPELIANANLAPLVTIPTSSVPAIHEVACKNIDTIYKLIKRHSNAPYLAEQLGTNFKMFLHHDSVWRYHDKIKKVLKKMNKDFKDAPRGEWHPQDTVIDKISKLEGISKVYAEKFGDEEGFAEHVILNMDTYNLEGNHDVYKAKRIIQDAFADKESLGKLIEYYVGDRALDNKKELRFNQDCIRNLGDDWVENAMQSALLETEDTPKPFVEYLVEEAATAENDELAKRTDERIISKINSVKTLRDKLRILRAIDPSTSRISRRFLPELTKHPFNVDDLEALSLVSSISGFSPINALGALKGKEGDLHRWFLREAKSKVSDVVGHKGKVHSDFNDFVKNSKALGALFEYNTAYSYAHQDKLKQVMQEFLKKGNKAVIAHKFKQEDAQDQVKGYATKLKQMYKEVLPVMSKTKTKDLFGVFATNISQFDEYKSKVVFNEDAEENLRSFLKTLGLGNRFKQFAEMDIKDVAGKLKEWGGPDAMRVAGTVIAKKKGLGIAKRKKSFESAAKVLDRLKALKGKPLAEQEALLSSIQVDKKVLDDLVFIHSALREKPMKLGVEALKNVYDAIEKTKPDKVNIGARLGNKIEDFLTMGYHGTSCYRPRGGFDGSMVGMLNDAHEHIVMFEQAGKTIGRANLHGARLGKELVFVLEKPYTDHPELSPQMIKAAESLCKKIHEKVGIRTIKQESEGKDFEVTEPETQFSKYVDYHGGKTDEGSHFVTGRLIEHEARARAEPIGARIRVPAKPMGARIRAQGRRARAIA